MRVALVFAGTLAALGYAQTLAGQDALDRHGREDDVLVPSDSARAVQVESLKEHRRLIESPGPDDVISLVEMFYARIAVRAPGADCQVPLDSIVPVAEDERPTNAATWFRVVADASSEVYLIEERPNSCGEREGTVYRHFFRNHRTVVFERHVPSATDCSGLPVAEITTYYFGPQRELIAKDYSLIDTAGRSRVAEECSEVHERAPYTIARDYDTLLRTHMRGITVVPG